jgi:hypothetical protein
LEFQKKNTKQAKPKKMSDKPYFMEFKCAPVMPKPKTSTIEDFINHATFSKCGMCQKMIHLKFEKPECVALAECMHVFCTSCMLVHMSCDANEICPVCKKYITAFCTWNFHYDANKNQKGFMCQYSATFPRQSTTDRMFITTGNSNSDTFTSVSQTTVEDLFEIYCKKRDREQKCPFDAEQTSLMEDVE